MKKIFTPINTVLFLWPVVLWFAITFVSLEEDFSGRPMDLLHHPIEYIAVLFILNLFGSHWYKMATETPIEKESQTRRDRKVENEEELVKLLKDIQMRKTSTKR